MKRKQTKSVATSKTIRRILKLLGAHRLLLALSLICAAISTVLSLLVPIYIGNAINLMTEGDSESPVSKILRVIVAIGICTVGAALSQWVMNVLNNRISYALVYRLRRDAFAKLQKLPISYLDTHPSGGILSRIMNDVEQFSDGLLMGFNQFFTAVLTILGTLLILLSYRQPSITAVVVLITPLSLFVASFIANRTHSMFRQQSETRAEQTAMINEYVGNHKVVVAFGQEDEAVEQFNEINGRLAKCSLRATFFSSLTNPSTRFVNNLVYAGVALTGAFQCMKLGLSIGTLTSFLLYANQYTKPFNEVSGVFAEVQNSLACAARVFELLDEAEIPADAEDARVLTQADGTVSLTEVEFSYSSDRQLIQDLNLSVRSGERIAIVGPTGCGKTTVINLLMRFYDVNDGSVAISGTDVRRITRSSLRANWGMVLQDTWLRAGTVRENICMAKPDATDEEMIQAAKAAHAHSFIRRLPNGYDTVLGEGGGSLSQGQKQLLCIARLMLCPPPMLILDEATSSIDTRMELRIQNAFAQLMKGRTSFIVAHRLSTVETADVILVMNDGRIVEQGNHSSLLAKKGFYYRLYNSQFED